VGVPACIGATPTGGAGARVLLRWGDDKGTVPSAGESREALGGAAVGAGHTHALDGPCFVDARVAKRGMPAEATRPLVAAHPAAGRPPTPSSAVTIDPARAPLAEAWLDVRDGTSVEPPRRSLDDAETFSRTLEEAP
jgi:hypothetical protein